MNPVDSWYRFLFRVCLAALLGTHLSPGLGQDARFAHRARIDVEAVESVAAGQRLDVGELIAGFGTLERFNWEGFGGAESARTWSFHWNVHRHGWTQGTFRFVPKKSGRVFLRLRGPWEEEPPQSGKNKRAEVVFDSVVVSGAVLANGGFDSVAGPGSFGSWRAPFRPVAVETSMVAGGSASARVWHDGFLEQEIVVQEGQQVTVTALARSWVGTELAEEVGDAARGRFDLLSEVVAMDGLCLMSLGDQLFPATWVDDLQGGRDQIWGRKDFSWGGEFAITPWFWTPFEIRFTPRNSGEVRFYLKGPWEQNSAGRVRVQPVEWDGIQVVGTAAVDGGFERSVVPDGWRDPQRGATAGMTQRAHEGTQALFSWHDGSMEARLSVVAGREVRIRGFARSPRAAEAVGPDRLEGEETPAHRAVRRFQRGVNLGNFLEEAPGSPNYRDFGLQDLTQIAAEGFDHVRIPVAWHHHWRTTGVGIELDAAFLARVDTVLDQAAGAGLAVLVDWHHFDGLMTATAIHRPRFVQGWGQLAAHFASRPATVAVELLNEPTGPLEGDLLNGLLGEALAAVRAQDPHRTVFVGPGKFQAIDQLQHLRLPAGESNVVVTVHCYEPFLFTHQGADWTGGLTSVKGFPYPGVPGSGPTLQEGLADWVKKWFVAYQTTPTACSPASAKAFRPLLGFAREWSRMMGRPVHVGEFGVYRAFLPPGDSAREYLRDMRLALAEMGLAWSLWEWKAGFGYWDSSLGRPHPGAVSGLWGRPEIRQQPVGGILNEGAELILRVEAFGHPDDGPLSYEWFRDEVSIQSGASAELRRPMPANGGGTYRVVVANRVGSSLSTGAVVMVRARPSDVATGWERSGNVVTMSWPTEEGWRYELLEAANLGGPWTPVVEFTGNGAVRSHLIRLETESRARWFRVQVKR